jgi:hypothetical protein
MQGGFARLSRGLMSQRGLTPTLHETAVDGADDALASRYRPKKLLIPECLPEHRP